MFSLLLKEHIFSKKLQSKKRNEKGEYGLSPGCMYTSAFNNIFAELIVNDKEEFRRYLRINAATYHYFFFAGQNNRVSYITQVFPNSN